MRFSYFEDENLILIVLTSILTLIVFITHLKAINLNHNQGYGYCHQNFSNDDTNHLIKFFSHNFPILLYLTTKLLDFKPKLTRSRFES